MKSFIITIDTEGDNLWQWKQGDTITTENVKFLPRFQQLCDEYGYKPVWLTNFEMVSDPKFVAFTKEALRDARCEIGMHLHAVNNPPISDLPVSFHTNFPYLIEYPDDIIRQKLTLLNNLLENNYDEKIVSHRAGRWAMNGFYANCLIELGYKVDCSVTPGINWQDTKGITADSHGSDYSKAQELPFFLDNDRLLLEVPVSIRKLHYAEKPFGGVKSFLRFAKRRVIGYRAWLRPNGKNLKEMLELAEQLKNKDTDYVMFMLHSSELMPGGSPTFKTVEDIEHLYKDLKTLFNYMATFCEGRTLKEYTSIKGQRREEIPFKQIF